MTLRHIPKVLLAMGENGAFDVLDVHRLSLQAQILSSLYFRGINK